MSCLYKLAEVAELAADLRLLLRLRVDGYGAADHPPPSFRHALHVSHPLPLGDGLGRSKSKLCQAP